ncbi:MAG: serine--tRNA ligase, partial [Candidatus Levybacteria bacterium RBG_16_35_6]
MLDIKVIRENSKKVEEAAKNKGIEIDIKHLLEIDSKRKELQLKVQSLREERNALNEQIKKNPNQWDRETAQSIKQNLEKSEKSFSAVEDELKKLLLRIPNIPKPDVKAGKDESENEVLKKVGTPKKFSFTSKDHLTVGEGLDIIDIKRAAKVSGTRFYYLKNDGVLLEFALRQLAFEFLVKEGFTPILPPVLIKEDVMKGLGYMENGGDEDMFILDKDKLVLVGTSEQSIVPFFKDEILDEKELPKRFVGFSTCFRREAGSYGKDTKGIFRVHQFDKAEIVSFVKEGEDDKEHEYLLSLEEKLLGLLDIPYRVVKMCTGDLGFPAARKYDLEGWFPSEERYRELTSTSTTTDFQARRLN